MKKEYTVGQVKEMVKSQRNEITSECELISKFLKMVPQPINLAKELPTYDFKGQTIEDGFSIDFNSDKLEYKYTKVKEEYVLFGYESDTIRKTIDAYVVSPENKVFLVEVQLTFANPKLSTGELVIRAGHYFLVCVRVKVSYALNQDISYSLNKLLEQDELNEKISAYYVSQRIRFKIRPLSQKFVHGDSDTVKMLIKEGILNKKLFFKKNAFVNHNFSIVTEIIRCTRDLNKTEVIAVKGRKKAYAGRYYGSQLEVVTVVKSLYINLGKTRMYLGKTEKIFSVHRFVGPLSFKSIEYNGNCIHTNLPRVVEFK